MVASAGLLFFLFPLFPLLLFSFLMLLLELIVCSDDSRNENHEDNYPTPEDGVDEIFEHVSTRDYGLLVECD